MISLPIDKILKQVQDDRLTKEYLEATLVNQVGA